ncbi:unannotated protein [freshwater metagenome]|uniref:4a-hydroxytetrahydrobiopterin dehydratase n=1 Tax=freshwater metagenome TaxID=449393 RepID=A0A6J7DBA3_9ZZZZ|nr:4a-hydroxytetrahydrobiopterin dehydratase [Actinomycetota bacterium]
MPLNPTDVVERLGSGPWTVSGSAIQRDLAFEDFLAAVAFVNRVAALAEEADHHPDLLIHDWNQVRLTLSTHSAGGITDADLALAARIDALS